MTIVRAEFVAACKSVLFDCKDEYAKSYAKGGIGQCFTQEEMQVQCLYILNNIQHWRGDTAKSVRATLKAMSKVKV